MDHEKSVAVAVKALSNQFHRYAASVRDELATRFKEVAGITEVQGRIIEYLFDTAGKDPVYQRDLEKQFTIRRSTATIALQRMEKAGLIRREVSADDARLKRLCLTDRARKIHPAAHATLVKAEARARKGLTEREVETFLKVAKQIVKNMQ